MPRLVDHGRIQQELEPVFGHVSILATFGLEIVPVPGGFSRPLGRLAGKSGISPSAGGHMKVARIE